MSKDYYPDYYEEEQFEPKVNPVTYERYKRDAWWRVTFPVVSAAVVALVLLALLIILGGAEAISAVADFALILLLIILAIPIALIVLALFAGLVWLMTKALAKTPPYSYKAQKIVQTVYEWTDRITDRAADVVIAMRSQMAGVEAGLREAGIDVDYPEEPEEPNRVI